MIARLYRRGGMRFSITLGRCSLGLSLDGDFHVRACLKAYFLTLVIRQGIVDAYFSRRLQFTVPGEQAREIKSGEVARPAELRR
jgi:hypothetical protein